MKKITFILPLLCVMYSVKAQNYDIEGIPDRDLFGNYIIIRLTPLCNTKDEAVNEIGKFKAWCEENTFMKPYTLFLGFFQVKSIEKDKSLKWFGGYCNYKRQKKELYEMDERFLQVYCSSADIVQFKEIIKNDNCPPEK